MKAQRILLLATALLVFFVGAHAQDGYVIKGKIKGLEEGMQLVLVNMDKNADVDRVAPSKNGSFEFTGKVEEICNAYIRVVVEKNTYIDHIAFYLENETYELKTDLADIRYANFTGTSEHNRIGNILRDRQRANNLRRDEIGKVRNNLPKTEYFRSVQKDGETMKVKAYKMDSSKIDFDQVRRLDNENAQLYADNREIERQFVDEYTNSYPALVILNAFAAANKKQFDDADKMSKMPEEARERYQRRRRNSGSSPSVSDEELADYYEEFSRKLKKTTVGEAFYANLYERLAVNVGDKYYEFDDDVIDLDENPMKITDIDHEYVLMTFTSTGCTGCQLFNKAMIPKYDLIKDKIEIVAYYVDRNIDYVRAHTEKKQIKWKVVSDFKGENSPVKNRYQVYAIPQYFLLDKDRKIIKYQGGFSEEFVAYLVELGSS